MAATLVYLAAVWTEPGQALDIAAFRDESGLRNAMLDGPTAYFRTGILLVLAAVATVVGLEALLHRRVRAVVLALLLVTIAVGLTSILRRVLPRPDLGAYGYVGNTLPSVHAAAAAALVLAVLRLLPPGRQEPATTVAAAVVAAGASFASVLSFAHRPSDVVAGILLAGAVAAPFLPGRMTSADRRFRRLRDATTLTALALIILLVLAGRWLPEPAFVLVPLVATLAAACWVVMPQCAGATGPVTATGNVPTGRSPRSFGLP